MTSERQPRLVQRMLQEVAIYGGLPMRRADIYALACEHLGDQSGRPFGADYFAFHGQAVDMEPWPLEEARRIMS